MNRHSALNSEVRMQTLNDPFDYDILCRKKYWEIFDFIHS